MKLKYYLTVCSLLCSLSSFAQNGSVSIQPIYGTQSANTDNNFCQLLTQLISDACAGFTKAKGKEIETNTTTSIWSSNIGLPGMVTSSLIYADSWRYEGVAYQGISVEDMHIYYDKYKKLLENCLLSKGYILTNKKNPEDKLAAYPQFLYAKPAAADKTHTPYVMINVEYTGNTDTYTLTVNVLQ